MLGKFFRSSEVPPAAPAEPTRYRRGPCRHYFFDGHQRLLVTAQEMTVVSNEVADFLDSCSRFKTMGAHLESFAQDLEGTEDGWEAVRDQVPSLIERGFLIDEKFALEQIREVPVSTRHQRPIFKLALLDEGTEADFERALADVLAYLAKYRRVLELVIVSERLKPEDLRSHQAETGKLGVLLSVLTPANRSQFAAAVAVHGGLARELVDFALAPGSQATALNALMLSCLRPLEPPTSCAFVALSTRTRLDLWCASRAGAPVFSATASGIRPSSGRWEGDFLALHERYLGRRLAESIGGFGGNVQADLAASDPDFLRVLPSGWDQGAVTLTSCGENPEAAPRLDRSWGEWSSLGIELRQLHPPPPPMLPVAAGSGRLFAHLLALSSPPRPWIVHLPAGMPGTSEVPTEDPRKLEGADVLVELLILRPGSDWRQSYREAGAALVELALQPDRFAGALRGTAIAIFSQRLAERIERDEGIAKAIRRRLLSPGFEIPREFDTGETEADRERFRSFVQRCGELIQSWPELLDAATAINHTPATLVQRVRL